MQLAARCHEMSPCHVQEHALPNPARVAASTQGTVRASAVDGFTHIRGLPTGARPVNHPFVNTRWESFWELSC
jgi:hypothetical protein